MYATTILLGAWLAGCKTAAIDDGAQAGPLTQVSEGFVSAFFAETGDGRVVLFDAGNDAEAEVLVEALSARGYGPDDVAAIFLSHGHGDHTGGAQRFPYAALVGGEADTEIIADESDGAVSLDSAIVDGEVRRLGALTVQAYAVPGHTPGSTVYLVDGDVLVLGDVLVARKDGTVGPPPAFFSEDPAQNDASVRALADRLEADGVAASWMVFSHSAPLSGIDPLLAF